MPEREEEDEEDVRGPGELEAKLASSRLSRAWGWRLEYGRDMMMVGVLSFSAISAYFGCTRGLIGRKDTRRWFIVVVQLARSWSGRCGRK